MRINLEKIKVNYNQLLKLRDSYEFNVLNYNNELKNIRNNWNSEKSFSFFEGRNNLYHSLENNLEVINSLIYLYSFIIEKYEVYGNKINISLDGRDLLVDKINLLIGNLESILKFYEGLDYDIMSSFVYQRVEDDKKIISNIMKDMVNLKKSINNIFAYVSGVESKVYNMVSKIDVKIVNEDSV